MAPLTAAHAEQDADGPAGAVLRAAGVGQVDHRRGHRGLTGGQQRLCQHPGIYTDAHPSASGPGCRRGPRPWRADLRRSGVGRIKRARTSTARRNRSAPHHRSRPDDGTHAVGQRPLVHATGAGHPPDPRTSSESSAASGPPSRRRGLDGVEITRERLSAAVPVRSTNARADRCGGGSENRSRVAAEVVETVADGSARSGVRVTGITPKSHAGDTNEVDTVSTCWGPAATYFRTRAPPARADQSRFVRLPERFRGVAQPSCSTPAGRWGRFLRGWRISSTGVSSVRQPWARSFLANPTSSAGCARSQS